jgi:hypothetical protein
MKAEVKEKEENKIMKMKAIALGIVAVMIIAGGLAAVDAGNGNGKGGGANEIPLNGPHYNLNIIGKKDGWNGNPSNNLERHTIFVPEDTSNFQITLPMFEGATDPADFYTLDGIAIWMTQGDEFEVQDCNAFDDGECKFQLGPGKYRVFICAKAKPKDKDGNEFYTDINGWVYAHDDTYGDYYLYDVGYIHVKGKKWNEATDLFYVSPGEDYFGLISEDMWVFEYLSYIEDFDFTSVGSDIDIDQALYFWQYDNHGNKLVKVRFYPI